MGFRGTRTIDVYVTVNVPDNKKFCTPLDKPIYYDVSQMTET